MATINKQMKNPEKWLMNALADGNEPLTVTRYQQYSQVY